MKINDLDVLSPDAKTIIKMAADEFLSRKNAKKLVTIFRRYIGKRS